MDCRNIRKHERMQKILVSTLDPITIIGIATTGHVSRDAARNTLLAMLDAGVIEYHRGGGQHCCKEYRRTGKLLAALELPVAAEPIRKPQRTLDTPVVPQGIVELGRIITSWGRNAAGN